MLQFKKETYMVTGSFSLVGIEDGIGNETIFTITSTSNKPGRPSSVNTDGYVPDGWYANPQDVSATYQYQWVCKREKKEGNWGAWSEPSLYSNFADGVKYVLNYYGLSSSATTEPTSWSLTPPTMTSTMRYLWNYEIVGLNSGETYETDRTVIGVYGDDGEPGTPGTDGIGIDYIREYYLATSQSSGVTTSTSGWTMSIQTITPTKKYLWNYEVIMYTNGYRDVGDPKIIGVYGDKGDQGDPGQDGADGTDGKGYEYCYNYTTVNVRPETPASSVNDNVTPAGWYTYPPSISASRPYIWECQRVKSNGVWSAWSTPTLKNRWAYDGIDGANGDKGAKMRMRTWASGVRYLQGAEGEEFYDIVVYETKLYLCTKTHTSSSSNNPIKSIESYLGYWESAQQWTFIATQLLLAGKIVSDKITADLIDADGITAKDVDISGKITATRGTVGGFLIDRSSIKSENGNIELYSDGSIILNGYIQLKGFYKSFFTISSYKTLSNGIRLYYFEKDTRNGYTNVGLLIPDREGDKFLLPNDTEYYATYFYVINHGSYSISPYIGGNPIPAKRAALYFAAITQGSNIAWVEVAVANNVVFTSNPEDIT